MAPPPQQHSKAGPILCPRFRWHRTGHFCILLPLPQGRVGLERAAHQPLLGPDHVAGDAEGVGDVAGGRVLPFRITYQSLMLSHARLSRRRARLRATRAPCPAIVCMSMHCSEVTSTVCRAPGTPEPISPSELGFGGPSCRMYMLDSASSSKLSTRSRFPALILSRRGASRANVAVHHRRFERSSTTSRTRTRSAPG